MQIKLDDVRLNWIKKLFTPQDFKGDGNFRFGVDIIIEPKSEVHKKLNATIKAVGEKEFGKSWPAIEKKMKAEGKICLKDGDGNLDKNNQIRNGYEGMLFVKAANDVKPRTINRAKKEVNEVDGLFYNGCRGNVILDVWAQNNDWGKRINAKILGVQFFADDEPLGSASVASLDDFDEYEEEHDLDSDETVEEDEDVDF